jgi:hypothetical protein
MFRPQSAIIRCYYLPKLLTVSVLIVHIHFFFTIYVSLNTTPLLRSLEYGKSSLKFVLSLKFSSPFGRRLYAYYYNYHVLLYHSLIVKQF